MHSGALRHLNRALCRVREVVIASFSSSSGRKSSIDCELIDRELKELQSLVCIPKAGSEQPVDSAEELAALIKVRELLSCLRNFLQTRSEVFTEKNLAVFH